MKNKHINGQQQATSKQAKTPKLVVYPKIILKWIVEINVKHITIKLLEGNTGETSQTRDRPDFLEMIPKALARNKTKRKKERRGKGREENRRRIKRMKNG